MDQGLYDASIALGQGFRTLDVHAENLAHARAAGYRRRIPAERSFQNQLDRARHGTGSFPYLTDERSFEAGTVHSTDNPFDVALKGPGFFAVEGRNEILYTRAGTFTVAPDGTLVTREGFPVLGRGGPIRIDPQGGTPTIDTTGQVIQDEVPRGTLRVVEFDSRESLESAGSLHFRSTPGTPPRGAASTTVHQRYREDANVDMMEELVGLMTTFRKFEAAQRAVRTIDRTLDQLIQMRAR